MKNKKLNLDFSFKIAKNMLLNTFFSPLIIAFFLFSIVLALTPINSSVTGIKNVRSQMHCSWLSGFWIVTKSYFNIFLMLIESAIMKPLGATHLVNDNEFYNLLKQAEEKYHFRPLFFVSLSAHYSNFELLTHHAGHVYHELTNRNVYIVAKKPKLKFLAILLEKYRTSNFLNYIYSGKDTLNEIRNSLKNKHSLALAVDQKPKHDGVFIKFFEKQALFPYKGLEIALEKKAFVFYGFSTRLWPGVFRIIPIEGQNNHLKIALSEHCSLTKKIVQPASLLLDPTLLSEMSHYVEELTKLISQKPGAWFWIYKRWSRQPKEEVILFTRESQETSSELAPDRLSEAS